MGKNILLFIFLEIVGELQNILMWPKNHLGIMLLPNSVLFIADTFDERVKIAQKKR